MRPTRGMTLRGRLLAVTMLFVVASALYSIAAPQTEPAIELSDEKLKAVAGVYIKVFEIQQTYRPQIEGAETPEEANQLQQAANQEMISVIESEEDVTVQDYNDVMSAIRNDDELRDRLQTEVDAILEEEE